MCVCVCMYVCVCVCVCVCACFPNLLIQKRFKATSNFLTEYSWFEYSDFFPQE